MSAQEKRIFLIIDPESIERAKISGFLADMGFEPIEAERLKDALDVINTTNIDGIISDWDTPGANGYTLLKLLRSQERFKKIIFIMMSKVDADAQKKILQAGSLKVDGFLLKPFLKETLEAIIKKALRNS